MLLFGQCQNEQYHVIATLHSGRLYSIALDLLVFLFIYETAKVFRSSVDNSNDVIVCINISI